jgi:hypothetical protein
MREIHEAADRKFREGREKHGPQWQGDAFHLEGMSEALDLIVYLRLTRNAFCLDFNPDLTDELTSHQATVLSILDGLDNNAVECALGLRLLTKLLDGDSGWKRLFP